MNAESPRFRTDLEARRGEADGVTYYDVTDRKTGTTFRMYEVEYLVAKALDGRALDAVARDVTAKLGVETNADELRGYVTKLDELGFLDRGELAKEVGAALESAVLDAQKPSALATKAQQRPAKATSDNQSPAIAAGDALSQVSQMFKVIAEQHEVVTEAAPSAPMFADEARTKPFSAHERPTARMPRPTDEPTEPTPPLPIDALEEVEITAEPVLEPPKPPLPPPPPPPPTADEFDADAKTPVVDPSEVETLVRSSTAATRPSLPAVTVEADVPDGTSRSVIKALEKMDPASAPEVPAQPPARPPSKPPGGLHHEPTDKVSAVKVRRRGTSPWWLAVPLLVIGGLVAMVYLPTRHGSPVTQVRVEPVKAETIVRLYPGTAQLHAAPPIKLAFTEGGVVSELLPPGQQVKAGDILAKLDGYAKLEKALVEVRSRETFYRNELDKAERAGNEAAIKHARAKVEEKRAMIASLQAKYGRFVLSSTAPGTIGENLVKVGDTIEAGQPVTTITQVRLRADVPMPQADASALKTGMIVRLARDDGKLVDCRVDKVDEEGDQAVVHVEVIDVSSGVQAGDRVRLVRWRLEKVFRLPTIAVQHTAGGQDQVFVVQDGKARVRVVTVLDRDPREVIVGPGLASNDQVVVSGMLALRDGASVQTQ